MRQAELCTDLGIDTPFTLFAPGTVMKAEGIDRMSRNDARLERALESSHELRQLVVSVATEQGWTLSVDLFATADNAMLPRFYSRMQSRGPKGWMR